MTEFQGSQVKGTALVDGLTFRDKPLIYSNVNGTAIFEGDIVLGKVEDLERLNDLKLKERTTAAGVGITGIQYLWPENIIPYEIDPALPNKSRVHSAISHIVKKTDFRFISRTHQLDWVTFTKGTGCTSSVGRIGGRQYVTLADGCTTGSCIHEILHVIGLWHEQSREDRDLYVKIIWENIIAGFEHNFTQRIHDGDDILNYNFASIMHYPDWAFTSNGLSTIVARQPNVTFGLRETMSEGDILAVQSRLSPVVNPPEPPEPGEMTTQEIREHQYHLTLLGWPIIVDGDYGPVTTEATALFQAGWTWPYINNTTPLKITGQPDADTRQALVECANNKGKLSPHFAYSEFRDSRTGWIKISWLTVLLLEKARAISNIPMYIVQGFGNSGRHAFGDAVDIPRSYHLKWFEAKALGFSGIGVVDDGTGNVEHLDTRYGIWAPKVDMWFHDPITREVYNQNKIPLS